MVLVCSILSIICAMVSFWQGLVLMGFAQMFGEVADYAAELEDAVMSVMICISTLAALLGSFGALERRWWSWLALIGSAVAVLIAFIIGLSFRGDVWPSFPFYVIVYVASAVVFKFRARVDETAVGAYVDEAIYGASRRSYEDDVDDFDEVMDDEFTPRQAHEVPSARVGGEAIDDVAMVSMLLRARPSSHVDDLIVVAGQPSEVLPAKGPSSKLYRWPSLFGRADFSSVAEGGIVRLSRWTLDGASSQRMIALERELSREFGAHTKEWQTPEGKRYLKYLPKEAPGSVVLLGIQGADADITIQLQGRQR